MIAQNSREVPSSKAIFTGHSPPPINTGTTTITTSLLKSLHQRPSDKSGKIEQESVLNPKEIIKAKKEQDEEKQDSTYSIRSTDRVDLEEFDLKNEDTMDKEVADKVKDHKRKHELNPLRKLLTNSMKPRSLMHRLQPTSSSPTSTGWQITDTRDVGADLRCTDLIPNHNILNILQMKFPKQDEEEKNTAMRH
ncbi:hypothetical protein Tco_0815330 [Tanacetum coccineum]